MYKNGEQFQLELQLKGTVSFFDIQTEQWLRKATCTSQYLVYSICVYLFKWQTTT